MSGCTAGIVFEGTFAAHSSTAVAFVWGREGGAHLAGSRGVLALRTARLLGGLTSSGLCAAKQGAMAGILPKCTAQCLCSAPKPWSPRMVAPDHACNVGSFGDKSRQGIKQSCICTTSNLYRSRGSSRRIDSP